MWLMQSFFLFPLSRGFSFPALSFFSKLIKAGDRGRREKEGKKVYSLFSSQKKNNEKKEKILFIIIVYLPSSFVKEFSFLLFFNSILLFFTSIQVDGRNDETNCCEMMKNWMTREKKIEEKKSVTKERRIFIIFVVVAMSRFFFIFLWIIPR